MTSTPWAAPAAAPGRASPSVKTHLSRNPALDGLRAVAVIAVVYRHLGLPGLYGGGVGVFAFFTLSGFIITFLLCAELAQTGRINLGAFWMRRARRLLPALLVTVALSVVLASTLAGAGVGSTLRQALPALGYVSNWWRIWVSYHPTAMALGPFDHTWSLSIEEQFYVTWPLLFLLMARLHRSRPLRAVLVVVVVAALSAATRWIGWDSANPTLSAQVLYNRTDSEAELLLLGAAAGMLAWYLVLHGDVLRRLPLWLLPSAGLAGLGVLALAFVLQPSPDYPDRMHAFWTLGLSLIALGVSALCLHLLLNPRSVLARLLSVPPLPALGRISYGIYLYHYPIVLFVLPRFADHPAAGKLVAVVATLALATASWWLIERPILRRGRHRTLAPSGD